MSKLENFSPKVRIFVQFYEPWIVYIDADIDSCQPGADVTSPNSCRDVCIKLSTCDHSACGEFYFCAKNLKIVIKSSSKSVALCINCIDNWVKMHGHVQYNTVLDLYTCVYKIVNGAIATYMLGHMIIYCFNQYSCIIFLLYCLSCGSFTCIF